MNCVGGRKVDMEQRRGQAIVEYLVVATVVIAAIIAIRPAIQAAVNALYASAATKANDAATKLGSLTIP